MSPAARFRKDSIAMAARDLERGRIDRRQFVRLMGALGLVPLSGALTQALAQATEIVVVNYGGDAVEYFAQAWGEPFTADTGIKVVVEGDTPLPGRIVAMVDSGQVVWDACDGDGFSVIDLGRKGYLEPTDYSVVDRSMIREGYATDFGFPNYFYSFVLAYDTEAFGDNPPRNWADFMNTTDFPGGRTLWKWMAAAPEALLLGSGTPRDQLYPIDMDKALAALETVKSSIVWWDSGADSQQVFLDGEVSMGCIWHTRANVLERDTGGRITWTWADGIMCPAGWLVPRGNPAGAAVQQFVASTLIPERQVELLRLLGNGPSNPAASDMLPEDLRRVDPGYPPNLALQIPRDETWYADNYDAQLERWLNAIAG